MISNLKNKKTRFLFAFFIVVLCGAFTAFTTTQMNEAEAIEGVTQYVRGEFVKYSDHETAWMTFDGVHGTCAMPWKIAPPSGAYRYTSQFKNLTNAQGESYPKSVLANYLYYGYGGPGFNEDDPAWPKTNRFGKPMTKEDYMVATHLLVSNAYTCNAIKSLHGVSGETYRWFAWDILGSGEAVGVKQDNPNSPAIVFKNRPDTLSKITPIAIMPGGQWQTCISYKKKTTTIELIKEDAASKNTPQPGLTLEGAVFEAIDENGTHYTSSTEIHGDHVSVLFTDIPFGKTTIKEIKAPAGYIPSQEPIEINLLDETPNAENVVILKAPVSESPIAFDIQIAKFLGTFSPESGLKEPGANISFDVISNTTHQTVATLVTDKDGFIDTRNQKEWYGLGIKQPEIQGAFPFDPAGYTVHEVESTTPAGYSSCQDWTITPEEQLNGICLKYIADNGPINSRIQIVKVDSNSGLPILKAGFTFELYDSDKELIQQQAWYPNHCDLTQFTTDETGCITLPEQLVPGTYFIKEVAAPAPYLIDETYHELNVSAHESSAQVNVIHIENTSAQGQLEIVKVDNDTQQKLHGAEFTLTAAEDIHSADGTLLASKDDILAYPGSNNYVVDDDLSITISSLPFNEQGEGHYLLTETKAPHGYVLPEEPIDILIQATNGCPKTVVKNITVKNQANEFLITKISARDSALKLSGATFAIWNVADEIVDDNAQAEIDEQSQITALETQNTPLVHHPEQVIVETTDKNGEIHLSHLKPGTYKWAEISAPDGYVLEKPNIHGFSVLENGHFIVEDAEIDEVVEENNPTDIVIEKRDSATEEFVANATLTLWHASTEGLPEGDPIQTWQSTDCGMEFISLPCGFYVITEDETPDGYEPIDPVPFEIANTTTVQTIAIYNTKTSIVPQEKPEPPQTMPQTGLPTWPRIMGITAFSSIGIFSLVVLVKTILTHRK